MPANTARASDASSSGPLTLDAIAVCQAGIDDREAQILGDSRHDRELVLTERARPVDVQRRRASTHGERQQEPHDAQVVIAVKVREQHEVDVEPDAEGQHLALGPLAAVDQEVIAVRAHGDRAQPTPRRGLRRRRPNHVTRRMLIPQFCAACRARARRRRPGRPA
jgi:hypothetical protein